MTIKQFINSINQIHSAEHVGLISGCLKHVLWHVRRLFRLFPVNLIISKSFMMVKKHNSIAALINSMGAYDFNNMHLIKLLLQGSNRVFFDIGANIGSYTLVASEEPSATVVSIEPHPNTFKELGENIELNKRMNVILMNIAASDCDGEVMLTDEEPHRSSLNRVIEGPKESGRSICVTRKTLDQVCKQLNCFPNIVKIDVEGHERKVLNGFQRSIHHADLLLIENGEHTDILDFLESLGFSEPLYFHFSKKAFLSSSQNRPEDPVYIRREFADQLKQMGFILPKNLIN